MNSSVLRGPNSLSKSESFGNKLPFAQHLRMIIVRRKKTSLFMNPARNPWFTRNGMVFISEDRFLSLVVRNFQGRRPCWHAGCWRLQKSNSEGPGWNFWRSGGLLIIMSTMPEDRTWPPMVSLTRMGGIGKTVFAMALGNELMPSCWRLFPIPPIPVEPIARLGWWRFRLPTRGVPIISTRKRTNNQVGVHAARKWYSWFLMSWSERTEMTQLKRELKKDGNWGTALERTPEG